MIVSWMSHTKEFYTTFHKYAILLLHLTLVELAHANDYLCLQQHYMFSHCFTCQYDIIYAYHAG